MQDFVDSVKKMCADEEMRKQMGQNGRRYVEENFQVYVSVEILERYHRNIKITNNETKVKMR